MVWDGRDRTPEPTVGKAGGGLGPEIFHQTLHSVHCMIEDSAYKSSAALGHGVAAWRQAFVMGVRKDVPNPNTHSPFHLFLSRSI